MCFESGIEHHVHDTTTIEHHPKQYMAWRGPTQPGDGFGTGSL